VTSLRATAGARSPLLLPVLFAPAFMVILDVFIVNVAAPSIRADLGASESAIQLIVVAYILSYAIWLITGGRLGDLFGRLRMFRVGVAGFTVASIVCAAAPTPAVLIVGRVLQGLGGALMYPQMLSIIQVEYPPAERQRALAYQNVSQALASIMGQVVGGVLIALDPFGLGWRTVFMINIPVGLLVLAVASKVVPESRSPGVRGLDLRGVLLATLGLALFLVPAIEGRELGWPPWVFVAMAASIPVAVLFVRAQRSLAARGGAPLVEPRLFARRGFRVGIIAVVIVFCNFSFFLWFSIFLQDGLKLSALASGLVYVPMATVSATVSFAVPRVPGRYRSYLPQLGAFVAGCGFVIVVLVVSASTSLTPELVLATLPLGAGLGLMMPTLMRLVLHTVPTDIAGSAAGTLATAQQVGNALGVALVGTIFFTVLGESTYHAAFAASTAAQALFALTAAWLLSRVRERGTPAELVERSRARGAAP
jgi:EmrB/QacA subfamily drug resistance transporter